MATIPETLAAAFQCHQAGYAQAAEQLYRQILAADPNQADAWHLLGVLQAQLGRHAAGVDCLRRSLALRPDWVEALYNLGKILAEQGKLDEAVACYRRTLELEPDFVDAYSNLGLAFYAQARLDEAADCFRRALELKPDYAEAHSNLGMAVAKQGKLDEAVACCRRALELKPDYVEAHGNLGNVLTKRGQLDEGIACYRRALKLRPDYAAAHNQLGVTLAAQGRVDEAAACYRRALELKPDFAEAHGNLGNVLTERGQLDEGVACYRRALELRPDDAATHSNLGMAVAKQGKLDEAVACCRRALELKPDYVEAHGNLGNALTERGQLDEGVACYRRALELTPDHASAHSNILYAMQYVAGVTPAELAAAHGEYERMHAGPLRTTWRPHENPRDRAPSAGWSRRLRIGFVSPDFARHPVGYLLIRVLENLDRDPCETVCYSNRILKDDLTTRFRAAATLWREVIGLSDEQLAERIRGDQIDVLFDLAGHTAFNRLLVFARKPAPIQITWIGYEGTTGLEAMDYILADRHTIPAGSEPFYRERVLRMPDGYVCFDPPSAAPEPGPLPAVQNGHVRFGSFNNLAKISPRVVGVWAKILGRVPQSRLMLKYLALADASVRDRYLGMFAALGVDPARIELMPPSEYAEYLAAYRGVDIALDPFPFGGGVTTCDAIWMGVPVVACPGETFASRHSLSHLTNVGLTETVARDLDEYVELAVSLAGDLPRLATLRAGLRERMAASPLCDGQRFAGNLMKILRGVWQEWCATM